MDDKRYDDCSVMLSMDVLRVIAKGHDLRPILLDVWKLAQQTLAESFDANLGAISFGGRVWGETLHFFVVLYPGGEPDATGCPFKETHVQRKRLRAAGSDC